jgi:hypothetical protein
MILLCSIPAFVALTAVAPVSMQEPAAPQQPPPEPDAWEFQASAYYSSPPNSDDRLIGIVYADRGPLHLEFRYNYEDLDTAALFTGWRFPVQGGAISGGITPMIGIVGGATDGIAPGLEADLDWKRLNFYTEAEYLFDFGNSGDDFLYSWSTLTWGFTEQLRAGLVAERNRVIDTSFDIQRGLIVQLSFQNTALSLYTYNIGSNDSYTTISFGYSR